MDTGNIEQNIMDRLASFDVKQIEVSIASFDDSDSENDTIENSDTQNPLVSEARDTAQVDDNQLNTKGEKEHKSKDDQATEELKTNIKIEIKKETPDLESNCNPEMKCNEKSKIVSENIAKDTLEAKVIQNDIKIESTEQINAISDINLNIEGVLGQKRKFSEENVETQNSKRKLCENSSVNESKTEHLKNIAKILDSVDSNKRDAVLQSRDFSSPTNDAFDYLSKLLTRVSDSLLIIVKHFARHSRVQQSHYLNQSEIDKSMKRFLQVKYHLFNLCFATVENIFLPNDNNEMFLKQFLSDTLKIGREKNILCPENQLILLLRELIMWTKHKKNAINTMQQSVEQSLSAHVIQQTGTPLHTANTHPILTEHINRPQVLPNINSAFPHQITANEKQRSLNSFFPSHHGTTTTPVQNIPVASARNCVPAPQNHSLPLFSYVPELPASHMTPQAKSTTGFINKGPVTNNSKQPSQSSSNFPNTFSNNPVAPSMYSPDGGHIDIFSSGPPGHEIKISVDKKTLKQRPKQNNEAVSNAENNHNSIRQQVSNYNNQVPYQHFQNNCTGIYNVSDAQRRNQEYQQHQQNTRVQARTYYPQQQQVNVNPNASYPAQWQRLSQVPQQNQEQLIPNQYPSQQKCYQPASMQQSQYQPLPLHTIPPWQNQPEAIHAQQIQNVNHRPPPPYRSNEQFDQRPQEVVRSSSTDSGFMSPTNFGGSAAPQVEQDDLSLQITHVTSLNPQAVPIPEGVCYVCGKTTRTKCMACTSRYYCSITCQQIDWFLHMDDCKQSRK